MDSYYKEGAAMKKSKGQVLVEFALILPLFLLLLLGIIYSGMLFHDYTTLSNIARSSAREAAVIGTLDDTAIANIKSHYTKDSINNLWTSLYKLNNADEDFDIIHNAANKEIIVNIKMSLNYSPVILGSMLPQNFNVLYYMKRDS